MFRWPRQLLNCFWISDQHCHQEHSKRPGVGTKLKDVSVDLIVLDEISTETDKPGGVLLS